MMLLAAEPMDLMPLLILAGFAFLTLMAGIAIAATVAVIVGPNSSK
jgi:hypothetical protein